MAADPPRSVADAAAALRSGLASARELTAEPDSGLPAMISAANPPESSPPWNTQAANAVLDAHAGIRHLENGLRRRVTGRPRPRGGSDANTDKALAAVVRLAEAADRHDSNCVRGGCDECRISRLLGRWHSSVLALPAIDEAIRWHPVRSQPRQDCPSCGSKPCAEHACPAACPYCTTYSLRAAHDRYIVACFNEDCTDDNGERPLARLELSRLNADPLLVWRDGRVQGAA